MSTIRSRMTMLDNIIYLFLWNATAKNAIFTPFEKERFVPIEVSHIVEEFLFAVVVKIRGYYISS